MPRPRFADGAFNLINRLMKKWETLYSGFLLEVVSKPSIGFKVPR